MYKLKSRNIKTKLKDISLGLASLAVIVSGSTALVPASTFAADPKTEACNAINSLDGAGATCDPAAAKTKLSGVINSVIELISLLVGAISVIMVIIGGFKYVTSNGDANSTKSAKDTVMYALIGLLLVGFAQTIVRFIWSQS